METLSKTSSTSTEACNTPTHTSILEKDTPHDSDPPGYLTLPVLRTTIGACPWKGSTYIIRDPGSELVITLKGGILGLHPQEKEYGGGIYHYGRGSHWHCVENEGLWLGFYNSVSGTYIGHNNNKKQNWRFIAKAVKHADWESFCVREHPGGGHVLLVKHWDHFLPMKVGGEGNMELVVDKEGEGGVAWEFIKVDPEV